MENITVSTAEISPDRFEGAAIWLTLTAEQQAAIGAAALEVVAARYCLDETWDGSPFQTAAHRAADVAMQAADRQLDEAFVDCVEPSRLTDGEDRVLLPSVIGQVCLACGCSQHDACEEGCGWAQPDLCTACEAMAVA